MYPGEMEICFLCNLLNNCGFFLDNEPWSLWERPFSPNYVGIASLLEAGVFCKPAHATLGLLFDRVPLLLHRTLYDGGSSRTKIKAKQFRQIINLKFSDPNASFIYNMLEFHFFSITSFSAVCRCL